jgi:lipopolysaccharide export system permease protein
MRLLNRYVAMQVAGSTLVVLSILVGLDALSAVIDEFQSLKANYTASKALLYVAASLPGRVVELSSVAVLIGVLVALGQLASSSELIVIRGAGLSQRHIFVCVIKPVLVFAGVMLVVGELVVPKTELFAETERALASSENGASIGRSGVWNREGQHFIHFNAVQAGGVIYGVTLFTFDATWRLQESMVASRASYTGSGWLLEQVRRTQVNSWGTAASEHTTLLWETDLTPDLLAMEAIPPDRLSINSLLAYSQHLRQQGLEYADFEVAAWRKLTQPVAMIVLVLLAMGFIFGPLRDGTLGLRVFIGTLVGLVFKISQDMVASITLVYGFEPWAAVAMPLLVGLFAGLALLGRSR